MKDIMVGDEVVCHRTNLYARVEEVFPAAVCVKVALMRQVRGQLRVQVCPQLWRADEIENLSVCHYCGARDDLVVERDTGVPFRVCGMCRGVLLATADDLIEKLLAR